MAALVLLMEYYGAQEAAGYSIPAAEHSTITSWGRHHEYDAFANMLKQYPTGLVAVVSDSYDIYKACEAWGNRFRDQILKRDGGLVIRPDSGYPPKVVCEILDILEDNFGSIKNKAGFKELPPQVRVIQGDGIDRNMIRTILEAMVARGWAADNLAFGSGGGLLQQFNRDTSKYAFKCSAIKQNGEWNNDISKDPVTDHGKKSKAGRLSLVEIAGKLCTVQGNHPDSVLREVYRNGELLIDDTLDAIRERCKI